MKLAYREYGSGRPLLILHGLFGQSDNWNTLAKNFSEQGFRVFTLDFRNHGLSPHSEVWNYKVMATDLKEFIEAQGLEKPILLGHSMGGKVLLFFEQMYPGLAHQLIIADISARYYPPHHQLVIEALEAVDIKHIKTRKEAESTLNRYIHDFGTKQFLLKNLYWREESVMDWRFNLKVISRNIEAISEAVPMYTSPVKTLVLRGERSNYINEEDLKDFEKRFPNVNIQTILQAGHWLHAEKPKEFYEAVLQFITT